MKKSQYEELKEDIEDIKDNHLPSIYGSISKLRDKIWYVLGALAILVPLVIAILVKIW